MRRRWREVSRRASRVQHGRWRHDPAAPLLALVVSAALIGAAVFWTAEMLLGRFVGAF